MVTLDTYRSLTHALGLEVSAKHRIYLDTKFWIYLRDAALGRPTAPEHAALLGHLTALVDGGTHVCPVELVMFSELMKQQDRERRAAVVRVVDRLSAGVCLIPPRDRQLAEVVHFLAARMDPPLAVEPLLHAVWTRPAFVAGVLRAVPRNRSPEEAARVADEFTRLLWSFSWEGLLGYAGPDFAWPRADTAALAATINSGNAAHAAEAATWRAAYEAELLGVFQGAAPVLQEAFAQVMARVTGTRPTSAELEESEAVPLLPTAFARMCLHADLTRELPSFHVLATLYARARRDRQRPFKGNDFEDYLHAAAALPYCDVFLTERSLAGQLSTGAPSLANTFGAYVTADPEAALHALTGANVDGELTDRCGSG